MAESFRYLNLRWVSVLALLLSVGWGQAAPSVPQVNVTFSVFALGGAQNLAYRPAMEKALQPLKFYSAYRSPPYRYRGPPELHFFDVGDLALAKPVARYEIPRNSEKLLLLFFPVAHPAEGQIKYEVYGVDDRALRVPAGHFNTINLSGRAYLARYGESSIDIPQGIGPSCQAGDKVSLRLAAQVEGHWVSAGQYEFDLGKRQRAILIFYPPVSPTRFYPIVRRLIDTVPEPKGAVE